MEHKSFDEILREKLRSHPPRFTRENEESAFVGNFRHVPFQDWSELVSPKTNTARNVGFQRYDRAQDKEKIESTEPKTRSESSKKTKPQAAEPPPPPVRWTFEQQLAIDQLIRMGAPLKLNSSRSEIKKAYRSLVQKFHPDRHQNLSVAEQQQLAEKFQFVVEAYKLFDRVEP